MAKYYGGVRNVPAKSLAFGRHQAEVAIMRESGAYSAVRMYNSGWVAIEKSNARHSRYEIEAAIHLARKGYKVTLKDEGGNVKTPDGKVFNFNYEQRTPDKGAGAKGVQKSIEHAAKKVHKGADIDVALIFDRYKRFMRKDVEEGIRLYEQYNRTRFKRIIVVSAHGNIHVHGHND